MSDNETSPALPVATESRAPGQCAAPAPPPAVARLDQHRLRTHVARALAELQYRTDQLGHTGIAGVALLVTAAGLYFGATLPQHTAVTQLRAQLAGGGPQVDLATLAAVQLHDVVARLPPRATAPEVIEQIMQHAASAGVELQRGQYEFIAARDGIAAHYRISLPVHTTYPQLRQFIDGTLAAMPAVAVEGLRIERKNVGDDVVDAELRFAAFVSGAP